MIDNDAASGSGPGRAPKVSALVSCYGAERYLPEFLESCCAQTMGADLEVVIVQNVPSVSEARMVEEAASESKVRFRRVVVDTRESFSSSINRAISAARGEYLCIWNVDDLRTPQSIQLMAQTLEDNPTLSFTYGDFVVSQEWPRREGTHVSTPPFDRRAFCRSMMLGPFFMWRATAGPATMWMDEQFTVGGDFDLAIRLALAGDGGRTAGLLGYYLDEGTGLSTDRGGLQRAEGVAIYRRYGFRDKVDLRYWRRSHSYQINEIRFPTGWQPVDDVVTGRLRFSSGPLWPVAALLVTFKQTLSDLIGRLAKLADS